VLKLVQESFEIFFGASTAAEIVLHSNIKMVFGQKTTNENHKCTGRVSNCSCTVFILHLTPIEALLGSNRNPARRLNLGDSHASLPASLDL
jgi:hypothetical protein